MAIEAFLRARSATISAFSLSRWLEWAIFMLFRLILAKAAATLQLRLNSIHVSQQLQQTAINATLERIAHFGRVALCRRPDVQSGILRTVVKGAAVGGGCASSAGYASTASSTDSGAKPWRR